MLKKLDIPTQVSVAASAIIQAFLSLCLLIRNGTLFFSLCDINLVLAVSCEWKRKAKKKLLMIFIKPLPRCRQCWSSSIIFFYFFCYLWLSFVELFIASHFPCSPLKTFPHVRPIRFWLCEFKQPFSYCLLFTVRVPVPNVALRQHLTIVS